jgi:hypothetical protein
MEIQVTTRLVQVSVVGRVKTACDVALERELHVLDNGKPRHVSLSATDSQSQAGQRNHAADSFRT